MNSDLPPDVQWTPPDHPTVSTDLPSDIRWTGQDHPVAKRGIAHELATQPVYGFNEGLDALYNLPGAAVNVTRQMAGNVVSAAQGADNSGTLLGSDPLFGAAYLLSKVPEIKPQRMASRFNEPDPWQNIANDVGEAVGAGKPFPGAAPETGGEQPTTGAGRFGRAIGQQLGASIVPTAGMVARGIIPATGAAMAQNVASATGAGISGETAKEAGYGPIGQTIAQVAGGFAGPAAYNIGKKVTTDIPKSAINYGRRVMEEARDPQLGADRDTLDMARKSNLDLNRMRENLYPDFPRGSNLQSRGFTRDDIANIVLRRLDGEPAADIARDYAHLTDSRGNAPTADLVNNYVARYREGNLTPMNFMDLAQEQAGMGRAQPILRGSRANMIIANSGEAAAQLYDRQMAQPARMREAFNRVLPPQSGVVESHAAERLAQEQAINAIEAEYPARQHLAMQPAMERRAAAEFQRRYQELWAQDPIPLDENLARLLSDPAGRSAYGLAMQTAAREGTPIPSYGELLKTFGIPRNPGLGLDAEGVPQPPAQYEEPLVALGAPVPVKALDYFQRALRLSAKAGRTAGRPEAEGFDTVRRQLLEHLDPEHPTPGEQPLVPGFRQLRGDYRAGMVDQEAGELAASLSLGESPKTLDALQEFDAMPETARQLFRFRFARNLESMIGNQPYGSDPLSIFNSRSAELIIRHVLGDESAARIMTGVEGARRTGAAMKWGENLALNLGSADTRQVLNEFRNMSPEQQRLVLSGLQTKVQSALGAKGPGQEVARQFSSENAQAILRAILPENQANNLIRTINREVISTNTKNFNFGNSSTAQTGTDVQDAMQAARSAAHLGSGMIRRYIDDFGYWLARQVGEERATRVVRNLNETNPPEMLRTLDRLIEMAPTVQERDALRVFREWGPFGPGHGWAAGETALAAKNANGSTPPPSSPHARKAPDGEWYIPDTDRPGSYLRVRNMPGSTKGALQVLEHTP
jgi:hypothetical protein